MSIAEPEWYQYLVWDMSDELYPKPIGFKKDTPKEILEKYKDSIRELRAEQEEYPNDRII